MPPILALILCTGFVLWLFLRDRKLRPMTSRALWIALAWFAIIGSRPVSVWLGAGSPIERPEDYLEGSPLDRNVFLVLIVAAFIIVVRRRLRWREIYRSNRFLFLFFAYCGVSILWADYSFVAFKRWFKDSGNLLMVVLVMSEADPVQALRAVFARLSNFAIPFSFILIKYFPDIGRYYNRWTWQPGYAGVTTNKNELGGILFICGIFLVWDFLDMRRKPEHRRADWIGRLFLFGMLLWLVGTAGSMTSLLCLLVGVSVVFWIRRPSGVRKVRYLGTYSLAVLFLVLVVVSIPGIQSTILSALGRNPTLTGRTALWSELIAAPVNPVLGAGYQNFWLSHAGALWEKFAFRPNQAHNGYLETYLNGGIIGVSLLMLMIVATGRKLKKRFLEPTDFAALQLSFLVVVVFYNWTEAMFNKLSLVWIIFLISALTVNRSERDELDTHAFSLKAGW